MTTPKYNFPEFVFQQPGIGPGNYVDGLNDLSNGVDTELGKTDLILNELTTDQALNNFTVSEDITAGVWTIIITQNEGNNLKFNINGVIIEHDSDTMSVNGTSLAGTDTEPNNVYVYVKETAGSPELVASNTAPEGTLHHVDCKLFIVGSISATTKTEYGGLDEQLTISEFNTRVWHTAYEAGVKYRSGLSFAAGLSSLTINTGEVRVVFKRQTTSQVSVPGTGFFFINAFGEFINKTDFSFSNYSNGGAIASNKYYSVVFGIVVNNPTLMFAIVQKQPSTEYTSAIGAYNDELSVRTIVPAHPQLTQLFLPICFGVIKNDANNYLQEVNGEYAHPIVSEGGAGGATSVSNVNNGNNESDFVTWNNTTGKYDPKTPIEVKSILDISVNPVITEWVDAGAMIPGITNGATGNTVESQINKQMSDFWDFHPDTEEYVYFRVFLKNWNASTVKVKFVWTASAGVGDVVFGIAATSMRNGDAIDSSWGTEEIIIDNIPTVGRVMISTTSGDITVGGVVESGNVIWFKVYRDATNVIDTLTVDARLIGVQLQYTQNSSFESSW